MDIKPVLVINLPFFSQLRDCPLKKILGDKKKVNHLSHLIWVYKKLLLATLYQMPLTSPGRRLALLKMDLRKEQWRYHA